MRYFESKQLHSCFASFSSGDLFVMREITRAAFKEHQGEKTISRPFGFAVAYADADKHFYDVRSLRHADEKELLQYAVTNYLTQGWTLNHPFLKDAQSRHWEAENAAGTAKRIKQGYVIPEWSADIKPENYQGGISAETFADTALQGYLAGGGCHGYIGHSVRKPALDAYIEKQFLRNNDDHSLFALWLTSSHGRHFGDSLECISFKEQKTYVAKNIGSIISRAQGYRAEESEAA